MKFINLKVDCKIKFILEVMTFIMKENTGHDFFV